MTVESCSISAVTSVAALPVASAAKARMGSQQGDDVVVLPGSRGSEQEREREQDKEVEDGRHLFERAFRRRKESSRAARESSSPPAVDVGRSRQIPTKGHEPNARSSAARCNGSGAASEQHVNEHGQAALRVNAGPEHDGEPELLLWAVVFPTDPMLILRDLGPRYPLTPELQTPLCCCRPTHWMMPTL